MDHSQGAREPLLLAALRQDYGDHVFKHLAPRDFGHLESALPHDLVFVAAGAAGAAKEAALLRSAAGRAYVEAAKKGAKLKPFGERRGGRVTWATEFARIHRALMWLGVGVAKDLVSASMYHSLVTTGKEGGTSSFGDGSVGKLGHGGEGGERVPRLIDALHREVVKKVAAGLYHSLVLTRDGCVFSFGIGDDGQLGHGNTDEQLVPKLVEGPRIWGGGAAPLTDLTDIAAGAFHSLAVGGEGRTTTGTSGTSGTKVVYTWGLNGCGQLGLGDQGDGTNRLRPTRVPGLSGVASVAARRHHSFAILACEGGTIMACGENYSGELGLEDTVIRETFTVVPSLRDVVDMDTGNIHSIAVTSGGELYTWGKGRALGHGGDHITRCLVPTKVTGGGIDGATVVQVAAGDFHSMALTTSGELYTWGNGRRGQLGHGGKDDEAVPRIVEGVVGGTVVVGMSGGDIHSLAITEEGRVLVFGKAADGRLGLGATRTQALTPTAMDGITIGEGGEEEEGARGAAGGGGGGGGGGCGGYGGYGDGEGKSGDPKGYGGGGGAADGGGGGGGGGGSSNRKKKGRGKKKKKKGR